MTTPQPLDKIGDLARRTQDAGFSGLLFTETGRTAYLNAAVASQAAPGLELSTGVAVAFPRSPFVTAASAWELQEANGREVPARAGHAGAHACGAALRRGFRASRPAVARLRARGEGVLRGVPNGKARSPRRVLRPGLHQSAVERGTHRCTRSQSRYGGGQSVDAADGGRSGRRSARASAGRAVVTSARHVVPKVAEGAAKSGRSPSDIAVIVPVMTIVGDSDEERHRERELVRASMSFYGSTPNYAFIWDEAGFEGTTARIREKQKAGDSRGWRRRSATTTLRRSRPSRRGMGWPTHLSRSTGDCDAHRAVQRAG